MAAARIENILSAPGNPIPQQRELEDVQLTSRVPTRNIRLAVCMVGGTSLAIYENGVSQEMFRLVHGQGVYGLLKRLTQSHAYIDILSGTSAGGMNTVMLSAALANGSDFRATHDLWVNLTSIDKLLQDPKDTRVASLLQGNTYDLEQLETVFAGLTQPNPPWKRRWTKPGIPSGSPGDRTHCTDIDLFVTGTYFEGQPRAYYDSRTRPIFTHDYAGVFTLRHRARWGQSHFCPDLKEPANDVATSGSAANPRNSDRSTTVGRRLARVARTTSSLPAVFEPSEVDNSLMNGVIPLLRQGTTSPTGAAEKGGDKNYIMDGGFLNNMPLDLVVKGIVSSPTARETLRKVFFIEPEPESSGSAPLEPIKPNAVQSVLFWRDVPTRQSLTTALRMVEEHNEKVSRVGATLDAVRRMMDDNYRPTPAQHNLWVEVCLQDLRDQLLDIWNKALELEGFEGVTSLSFQTVQAGEGEARLRYEEQRSRAQTLRAIRTRLYARMRDACWDLLSESDSSANTTPRPRNEEATWRLAEVDSDGLSRMIMRAIDEVYSLLYPGTDRGASYSDENIVGKKMQATPTAKKLGIFENKPPSTQVWRQLVYEELTRNGEDITLYRQARAYLHQLYALRDAAEVIGNSLAQLLAGFVNTSAYLELADALTKQTPPQTLDVLTQSLWNLLEGCLEEFLNCAEPGPVATGDNAAHRPARADAAPYNSLIDPYNSLTGAVATMDADGVSHPQSEADVVAKFQNACNARVQDFRALLTSKSTQMVWQKIGSERIQTGQNRPLEARGDNTILVKIQRRATDILDKIVVLVAPLIEDMAHTGEGAKATADEPNVVEKSLPTKKQSVPLAWTASYAREWQQTARTAQLDKAGKAAQNPNTLSPPEPNAAFSAKSEPAGSAILLASKPLNNAVDESNRVPSSSPAVERGLRDLDILMYPYERAANLPGRDHISLVHLSPRDVQIALSRGRAEDKLAGDALFNFGGFLKRSWRVNDILWGRLDASGGIAQTLLDRDRLTRILAADSNSAGNILDALDDYILRGDVCGSSAEDRAAEKADDTGLFLKDWYKAHRVQIEQWLLPEPQDAFKGYKAPPPLTNPEQEDGFNDLLEVALMRHQIEVLIEEVPDAVAQAIAEHAQWEGRRDASPLDPILRENSLPASIPLTTAPDSPVASPATPPSSSAPPVRNHMQSLASAYGFQPDDPTCDALQAQAKRLADQMFAADANVGANGSQQTQAGRVYDYFRTRYAIGKENVADDIPALVTLRRVAGMLLVVLHVLQNCLDGTDAKPAKKNSLNTLLTRGFLGPLSLVVGALYGFVTLLAQGSTAAVAAHAIVWSFVVLGVLALMLGWVKATGLVLAAIIVAVGLEALYWWAQGQRNRERHALALTAWRTTCTVLVVALGIAVSALLLYACFTQRYPLLNISVSQRGLVWGILLVGTLGVGMILSRIGLPLKTSAAPLGIISFERAGSGAKARAILDSWNTMARQAAVQSLIVDLVFIPLYSTTIGFACAWLAQGALTPVKISGIHTEWLVWLAYPGFALAWAQWLAGALDVCENIGLLNTLFGPLANRTSTPQLQANLSVTDNVQPYDGWPRFAAGCAKGKFTLIGIGLLYAAAMFGLTLYFASRKV